MTVEQQEMIEYTMQDIISFLMEDFGFDIKTAMDVFFGSELFEKLQDVETGLYLQGSAYVYEHLKRELGQSSSPENSASRGCSEQTETRG